MTPTTPGVAAYHAECARILRAHQWLKCVTVTADGVIRRAWIGEVRYV